MGRTRTFAATWMSIFPLLVGLFVCFSLGLAGCRLDPDESNGGLDAGPDGPNRVDGGTSDLGGLVTDAASVDDASAAGDTSVVDDASVVEDASEGDAGADDPPDVVALQVLAFNDFHGNLEPPSGSSGEVVTARLDDGTTEAVSAGGAEFFARHVDRLRQEYAHTVVVSAGDLIGASPLVSALFHDEPTIEVMNAIGLDISAVGNHEFDDGVAELQRLQYGGCHPVDGCRGGVGSGSGSGSGESGSGSTRDDFAGAAFTFLAANVVVDDSSGATIFPRYEVREFDGIPVAFIGMTLEATPSLVTPLGVAGLAFRDEAETVNLLVPELRSRGIETIVVLVHEGGFQTGLYDDCEGISGPIVDLVSKLDPAVDLVVSGHTHAAYNCEIAGKRVTIALSFGRIVTRIVLEIDRANHDVRALEATNEIVTHDVAPSEEVSDVVDAFVDLVAPLKDRVVGHADQTMTGPRSEVTTAGESVLGNLIADAQLEATRSEATGRAQIAFMNPGGVRANLMAGEVTYGDLFSIQPFGNTLTVVTLAGREIHQLLEQQFQPTITRILQPSEGFEYRWRASAENGHRIDPDSIRLDGRPLDMETDYRVTVNSFLATGGDGFTILKDGRDPVGGVPDVDALADYLAQHDPVSAPSLGRITRDP
ncbi:MAG: bifunctional metallophosphatase/5'-nucleotidase [Deltaproteobacteria bacterium]|nr:bifunctional metallophosphatase/5'-nucleotidase [Deltaproteobacteria bacterium]